MSEIIQQTGRHKETVYWCEKIKIVSWNYTPAFQIMLDLKKLKSPFLILELVWDCFLSGVDLGVGCFALICVFSELHFQKKKNTQTAHLIASSNSADNSRKFEVLQILHQIKLQDAHYLFI